MRLCPALQSQRATRGSVPRLTFVSPLGFECVQVQLTISSSLEFRQERGIGRAVNSACAYALIIAAAGNVGFQPFPDIAAD